MKSLEIKISISAILITNQYMLISLLGYIIDNLSLYYGQVGFRKHHSTIDHLVTLRVLMEESCLRGKGLYCCFVDFKKVFDMVPPEHLWRRMEELEMPSEYMLAIS